MVWNQSAQLSVGPVPRSVGLIYLSHTWSPSTTSTCESTARIKTSPPTGYPFCPASGGGLFAYLLDIAMQNAWIIYRQTDGARHGPLNQLEFRRDICSIYYTRYSLERPSVGRPFGRPKHLDIRVPEEIQSDRTDHFIESILTQRRCAVCGVKVKKQCSKCNVGLHMDACFATFHQL